jgi:hypothetical protein
MAAKNVGMIYLAPLSFSNAGHWLAEWYMDTGMQKSKVQLEQRLHKKWQYWYLEHVQAHQHAASNYCGSFTTTTRISVCKSVGGMRTCTATSG